MNLKSRISLIDLFAFVLLVATTLSLVLRFGVFGGITSGLIWLTVIGYKTEHVPLYYAALATLLIFGSSIFTVWLIFAKRSAFETVPSVCRQRSLEAIEDTIGKYHKRFGLYPHDLTVIKIPSEASQHVYFENGSLFYNSELVFYQKTNGSFTLATLGMDNSLGGKGVNADYFSGDELSKFANCRVPFDQYSSLAGFQRVQFNCSLILGAIAGLSVWFLVRENQSLRLNLRKATQSVVIVLVTTFVAVLLCAFYLLDTKA